MKNDKKDYSGNYTENDLWSKLKKYAKVAGKELVLLVLKLYYSATSANTPAWAKAVIISALGYFILPFDAIPDFIPGLGYTDDLGVLLAASATVATYITPEIVKKAETKAREWFG
jgi:uncharacterized membrane protein YkvA (DUF1232 family)